MLDKEFNHFFEEKLRLHFIELGLSKSTAIKIVKLIVPVQINGTEVTSNCSDSFYRDQFIIPKKDELEKIVKDCLGQEYSFSVVSAFQTEKKKKSKAQNISNKKNLTEEETLFDVPETSFKEPEKAEKVINTDVLSKTEVTERPRTLDSTQNFGTFIRCESNFVAYSACESIAKSPGNISNPLFIYGATGLGKTHLLHSVGNEIQARNTDAKILYVTSEDFVNDVIHRGIRIGKMNEVRTKYSNCDVLLVDDIQFLEKKDACQIEFFHTFNELYQKRKQIVITSDKFPKDIPNIEERLKSRFLQGLLVDIEPPGFEDRVSIIETKSNLLGLKMNQEISFLMATHAKTNIRELQGILKDLLMNQHMTGKSPTLESVTAILKRRFHTVAVENPLDITVIQKIVSNHFQIKISDLMGQSRKQNFVIARHLAMYLAKELVGLQTVTIANAFGKKDHTTILHAMAKIKESIEKDAELRANLLQIKKKIEQMYDK